MRNPYEEGSSAWSLFEAAEALGDQPSVANDERAAAMDRQTIAIYLVGAALSSNFSFIGQQMGELAQQVEMLPSGLAKDD